ncbi:MAG: 30S ribosomal protein S8 [Nanoarchaeota archaeon]|nr:MAG: 30S ribosomal protein S8 [Nanoarchaeota archaeon]
MQNDPLSSALSAILNAERLGKKSCSVKPISSQTVTVLNLLKEEGYVGESSIIEDGRGNTLQISLTGKINKIGSIKPRFSVQKDNYERFEKSFLPAKDFGVIIVSTPKGMMIHSSAKEKGLGGKLIAYCY